MKCAHVHMNIVMSHFALYPNQNTISRQYSLITQTFLGAAAGSLGLAVTASLGGSGVSIPNLSLPEISIGSSSGGSSKPAASAPVSKISFTKAPKGKLFIKSVNIILMLCIIWY